jgi:hypothetical protein
LSPREPKKLLLLNKNHKKIPMKSTNRTLRSYWISLKKRNLFLNNKKN